MTVQFDGSLVILMADDDEDDCVLVQGALGESGVSNKLYFVPDGEELMDYLFQRGSYSDPDRFPRPDLILLDLNMPRKDGRDALREIKSNPTLKSIPVVILTTSREESDKALTLELGACSFVTKPSSYMDLVRLFQLHTAQWVKG